MSAKPITKREQKWLDELEAVFDKCPSKRIGCFTTGYGLLTFFDKNVADAALKKIENHGNHTYKADADHFHRVDAKSHLGEISTPFYIESCQD